MSSRNEANDPGNQNPISVATFTELYISYRAWQWPTTGQIIPEWFKDNASFG